MDKCNYVNILRRFWYVFLSQTDLNWIKYVVIQTEANTQTKQYKTENTKTRQNKTKHFYDPKKHFQRSLLRRNQYSSHVFTCTRRESSNISRPRHNGRHFAGDSFRLILLNKKCCIFIKISQKFVPVDSVDKNKHGVRWWFACHRLNQ